MVQLDDVIITSITNNEEGQLQFAMHIQLPGDSLLEVKALEDAVEVT